MSSKPRQWVRRVTRGWSAALELCLTWWYGLRRRWYGFLQRRPHRSFRLTKRRDYRRSLRLPGYIAFTRYVTRTLWSHGKLFLWLVIGYSVFMIGLGVMTSQSSYDSLSQAVGEVGSSALDGGLGQVLGVGLVAITASTVDPNSLTGEQRFAAMFLLIMVWLTTVWLLREILLGRSPKLRDGLYNAGGPLIATLFVFLVLVVQLLPMGVVALVCAALRSVHLLTDGFGMMLFGLLAASVLALTLYWITSTVIALVVVALPGMYPLRAVRAAGDIVMGRRLRIMLRLLWGVVWMFVLWTLCVMLVVWLEGWLSSVWSWVGSVPIVPLVGTFLTSSAMVWLAAYVYLLYRKVVADDAAPA